MRVGQARRRDANEAAIIEALRDIGVTVIPLSEKGVPDLMAYSKWDGLRLIEVKMPKGTLTPAQQEMRALLPFSVARSVEQALAIYGVRAIPLIREALR